MALPKEQVMVTTLAGAQRIVFLGQRLNPIPLFDKLPPASLLRLPRPRYGPEEERFYTHWLGTETPPIEASSAAKEIPAAETPPAEEQLPALEEDQVADAQSGDEATRPSEDANNTDAGSAGKDAI